MLRTLIIDDEAPVRDMLFTFGSAIPLKITSSCLQAEKTSSRDIPRIVFLIPDQYIIEYNQ